VDRLRICDTRQYARARLAKHEANAGTDVKFVLLHEGKADEGVRGFFAEVWELYVKVSCGGCWRRG
jgi:hypothetical protein